MPLTKIQSLGITDGTIASADIASGAITAAKLASGVGGKVLQVVSATTTTDTTLSSVTYTDTTLTATISPTLATSKILILMSQTMRVSGNSATGYGVGIKILRGATLAVDLTENNTRVFSIQAGTDGIPFLAMQGVINYNYLDSPATTSSTIYKVQFCLNTTTGSASARAQTANIPSQITLLEIGA